MNTIKIEAVLAYYYILLKHPFVKTTISVVKTFLMSSVVATLTECTMVAKKLHYHRSVVSRKHFMYNLHKQLIIPYSWKKESSTLNVSGC